MKTKSNWGSGTKKKKKKDRESHFEIISSLLLGVDGKQFQLFGKGA